MKEFPKISIVIPSFNQGKYIGETIDSLLNQQYPRLELIIIDGGSTDSTTEVIRNYKEKLKFWVSEKDKGQSNAINKGFQHVTGDLFNWLNSDDMLEPGSLHSIAECFLENPDKKIFIGKTRFFTESGEKGFSGKIIFNDLETTIGFGQVNQPAMFYRTEIFRELGPVNENLHMCMDLDIWLRFLLCYGLNGIFQSEINWAAFRFHSHSKTVSYEKGFYPEKNAIYEELLNETKSDKQYSSALNLKSYPVQQYHNLKKIASAYHLWMADEFSINLKNKDAKKHFSKTHFFSVPISQKRRFLAVKKRLLTGNTK
jgi:glycosyltransferase involved in cell wall biosynthesis